MSKLRVTDLDVYDGTATISLEMSVDELVELVIENWDELSGKLEQILVKALFDEDIE